LGTKREKNVVSGDVRKGGPLLGSMKEPTRVSSVKPSCRSVPDRKRREKLEKKNFMKPERKEKNLSVKKSQVGVHPWSGFAHREKPSKRTCQEEEKESRKKGREIVKGPSFSWQFGEGAREKTKETVLSASSRRGRKKKEGPFGHRGLFQDARHREKMAFSAVADGKIWG